MRRLILFCVVLVVSLTANAQKQQQGVVKTRGRMVNGQLIQGKGLDEATIHLGDRSVVSKEKNGKKGTFSFPAKGDKYVVKDV